MFIQTKILKVIKEHPYKIIYNGRTNIELYKDVCKLYQYLLSINIDNIYILELTHYNKLVAILCSMFYKINIYYYKLDNDILNLNNDLLDSIFQNDKKIKKYQISNGGNIKYHIKQNKYITNWDKITIFYKSFKNIFIQLVPIKYDTISLQNFNVYSIYFLPLILLYPKDIKLTFKETDTKSSIFYINDGGVKHGLSIYHQYSDLTNYTKNKETKVFFSFTLNQFLLYKVNIYLDKIVGRLLPTFRIRIVENKRLLFYNNKKLKLPSSYRLLSKNKIEIIRKTPQLIKPTTKIYNFQLSNVDQFYISNQFYKMIFIDQDVYVDKLTGLKLFEYLLEKFPVLDSGNYTNINVGNYYVYNELINIDLNLFSLYIKPDKHKTKCQIILFSSYMFNYMERELFIEINNIIIELLQCKTIKISPEIINNVYKIDLLMEIKFSYILFFQIVPILITNIFYPTVHKLNKKRRQIIYTFEKIDIEKIKKYSIGKRQDYRYTFKIQLLTTLAKFFKNKLVLFNNKMIPITKNELDIEKCIKSEYSQHYLLQLIWFYLNIERLQTLYPFTFIQIDELYIDTNIHINKCNIKCDVNCIPIQIQYYITDNKIQLTISTIEEYDIIKYIIPEMFSVFV